MKNLYSILLVSTLSIPALADSDISDTDNIVVPTTIDENKHAVFYLGAGYGKSSYNDFTYDDNDNDDFKHENDILDLDSDGAAYKIYAGYYFNRIVGVEISYNDYGDLNSAKNSKLNGKLSPTSIAVSANVGYSFDNGLRPYAIAGLSSLDLKPSEDWLDENSMIALHYGFGGEFTPQSLQGVTFRVGYEGELYSNKLDKQYTSQNTDAKHFALLGLWYLGVGYQF